MPEEQPKITVHQAIKVAKEIITKMDQGDTTDVGKLALVSTGLVALIENAHTRIDILEKRVQDLEIKLRRTKKWWVLGS